MSGAPLRAGLLLAAAAAAGAPPVAAGPEGGGAILHGEVAWSGTVEVPADLEVAADATLTIAAGTRVRIGAADGAGAGWDVKRVEIHVKGGLRVLGTPEQPVDFRVPDAPLSPAALETKDPKPSYPWRGLVLWPTKDRRPREIRAATFAGAWTALQVPAGRVRAEDCVFLCCGIGLEAGSAYSDGERIGIPGGVARPVLLRCRFSRCGAGVFAERQGAPSLQRCAFAECGLGAGNERPLGSYFPLEEPGTTVDRCDFLRNSTGLGGPAIASGNLFVRNAIGLCDSVFQRRARTGVDFSEWRGNVFSGNTTDVDGGAVAEAGCRVEDPGYEAAGGVIDAALAAEGPALPPGLRLRAESAARGKAADGGDPGCFGEARPPPAETPWTTTRTRLRRPLAARLPAEDPPKKDEATGRLRPSPGDPLRGSWWTRLEAAPEGWIRAAGLAEGGALLLCWRFELTAGKRVELEIVGDLDEAQAWWNGEALDGPVAPRRLERQGTTIPVLGRSGGNVLLLRLKPRGPAARVGAALDLPEGTTATEAEIPAARPAPAPEAAILRARDGSPWLRLIFRDPLDWSAPVGVELRDGSGSPLGGGGAKARFDGPRTVRFGPLPDAALEGGVAVLSGFRAADGAPLSLPAEPIPFAAAPAK